MARRFSDSRLVIASHNAGKLREIAALMTPFGVTCLSAVELGLAEPEETGKTFAENAALKAHLSAEASASPALADDSGLVVAGLDGAPGLYSARWAETDQGRDFNAAMSRVETELGDNPDRSAHFICVLALAWPDGHCEMFEGRIEGQLVFPPRGSLGFGYDPIFVAGGYDITFGEMDQNLKHAISHRAVAFAKLVAACFEGP
ncbi:MAG: RdgB/HAM1 family non-canonical purine NTP pyrophosphatase [Alphaproteobacteria bacterium]